MAHVVRRTPEESMRINVSPYIRFRRRQLGRCRLSAQCARQQRWDPPMSINKQSPQISETKCCSS